MGYLLGVLLLAGVRRITASPRGPASIREASTALSTFVEHVLDPTRPAIPRK